MSSKISSKGQVTIPQRVRIKLGLRAGDRVEFVEENGRIVVKPERERTNVFDKYIGAFPHLKTREEIQDWIQEIREDDRTPE